MDLVNACLFNCPMNKLLLFFNCFCTWHFVWVAIWHLYTMPEKNRSYKSTSRRQKSASVVRAVTKTQLVQLVLLEACRNMLNPVTVGLLILYAAQINVGEQSIGLIYSRSYLRSKQQKRRDSGELFLVLPLPLPGGEISTTDSSAALSPQSWKFCCETQKKFFNWFKIQAGYGLSIWAF